MGQGEKLNKNSTWYKKRHPDEVKPTPVAPIAPVKPKNKFVTKLRKFFYLPT